MKKIILLSLSAVISLVSICQPNTRQLLDGVWTEKQNGTAEIKWCFHSKKGMFNNIQFWSNPIQVGGLYRLGRFNFDEKTNGLKLVFEKTFSATNATAETHESTETKEWIIVSVSDNEMIIRRPVIWDSEKKYKNFDGNTVAIRLKKIRSQVQDLPQTETSQR